MLTAFRYIPNETRKVAKRTLTAIVEKKLLVIATNIFPFVIANRVLLNGNNQAHVGACD